MFQRSRLRQWRGTMDTRECQACDANNFLLPNIIGNLGCVAYLMDGEQGLREDDQTRHQHYEPMS